MTDGVRADLDSRRGDFPEPAPVQEPLARWMRHHAGPAGWAAARSAHDKQGRRQPVCHEGRQGVAHEVLVPVVEGQRHRAGDRAHRGQGHHGYPAFSERGDLGTERRGRAMNRGSPFRPGNARSRWPRRSCGRRPPGPQRREDPRAREAGKQQSPRFRRQWRRGEASQTLADGRSPGAGEEMVRGPQSLELLERQGSESAEGVTVAGEQRVQLGAHLCRGLDGAAAASRRDGPA